MEISNIENVKLIYQEAIEKNLSSFLLPKNRKEKSKMKKQKTLQEVKSEIEKLEEKKEKYSMKLKQLQNQSKKIEKLANEKERKKRNHRLIQRGLIVERVIENPLMFTNEEIEKLLNISTHTEEYNKAYEEIQNQKK